MKNDKKEDNSNVIIDPATGLPQLPAGWFFLVEKDSWLDGWEVTICFPKKKRFLFWTYIKKRQRTTHASYTSILSKDSIYRAAVRAYDDWQAWKNRDLSLLGSFPPNKLEA